MGAVVVLRVGAAVEEENATGEEEIAETELVADGGEEELAEDEDPLPPAADAVGREDNDGKKFASLRRSMRSHWVVDLYT